MNKAGIIFILTASMFVSFGLGSCMKYGPRDTEDFGSGLDPKELTGKGLFITCEGNFMYGNASLSYYDADSLEVQNEVFVRANGIPLGDVAHSMVIRDGIGWIVVNNSGVIYAIDIDTFRMAGKITGFTSPRYIHFLSDEKAYVTQLWDERICIVNPKTSEITGYISTGMERGSESTEQMVQYGKYVFTNCWSYNDRIIVIDSEADEVVDEIEVGIQPSSMVMDRNGRIWTVTDGGYPGSPYGEEVPALHCINAETRQIEKRFEFGELDSPSGIALNGARDTLYFINKDVWRMPVDSERLPLRPFIEHRETIFYSITVNPVNSEVYLADAIDYSQSGAVLRYSPDGKLLDEFRTGITPGSFCWR